MTNLRKTIAVVVAMAMIFSMGMITFAYSDVDADTTVGEAVGILSNLGIFTGFEDGTFRPDETVTRAQMAAIVCRSLDLAEAGGGTVFNDVPADHWAAGYINTAQAQGIINGYGNGNFGPEDQVSYEQAIAMVVRALGYDLVAQSKGGYPTGYLSIASSEGITKNANGKVGDAAKRSTLAMLVYNSLEVRLLDQTSWTTDGSDEYSKSDDTILSKYLGVRKYEGVVTSVPFVDYAKNGYDKDDTPEISIENAYYTVYENGTQVKKYDDAIGVDCSLVDIGNLFGKKVVAYIGDDEDDNTGNVMVYAISEKSNGNTVTSISSTQLVDEEDKEYYVDAQVSYRKTGATKVYDLDLESDALFYVNYEEESRPTHTVEINNKTVTVTTTEDIAGLVAEGGRIDLISNDNDNKIEIVSVLAYSDEAVIKEVDNEDDILTFDTYTGDLEDIDLEADDELVIVYKDGALAEAGDLEADDTVSVVEVGNDVRILYVSSETVTGSVSSYDTTDQTVTIAGNEYELSNFNKVNNVANLANEDGIFYINVDGQIAHNETDSTSAGNYGLVIAVAQDSGIDNNYYAKVAMADGTIAEYDFTSKAKFYDEEGKQATSDDAETAEAIAEVIAGTSTVSTTGTKTLVKNAYNAVFKFTFNNGDISKVKTLKGDSSDSYLEANSKKYDADSMTYGSAGFDEDTIVFGLKEAYSKTSKDVVNSDDLKIGKISSFFADGDDEKTFASLDEDDGIYGVVVGYAFSATIPEDSEAVIITAKKTVTYNDDDAVQITGIQGGKEVTYTIYDEDNDFTDEGDPDALAKGDIVLVSAPDSENVVSDFKLLYTANSKGAGVVSAAALNGKASDDIYNGAGWLNKDATKNASSKFFIGEDITNSEGAWAVKEDGITIKSNANYTLVDYSESTKNPEISKKSSSAVFSTSSKYETYVFVRVYDDKLAEVVAYRYNAAE